MGRLMSDLGYDVHASDVLHIGKGTGITVRYIINNIEVAACSLGTEEEESAFEEQDDTVSVCVCDVVNVYLYIQCVRKYMY